MANHPKTTRSKPARRGRAAWLPLRLWGGQEGAANTQPSGDGCRKTRRDATGGPTSYKDPHVAFEEKHTCSQMYTHKHKPHASKHTYTSTSYRLCMIQ